MADHNANMYQRQGTDSVIVQDDKMEWEAAIQGDWSSQGSLEKSVDYLINEEGNQGRTNCGWCALLWENTGGSGWTCHGSGGGIKQEPAMLLPLDPRQS